MECEIELGDTVQCNYTGFKGVTVGKTEFINGCIQFLVAPKWDGKERGPPEESCIDSQSLKIIKKGPRHDNDGDEETEGNGGPMRKAPIQRGF